MGVDSGILIHEDESAELGTGAMIIFISMVIAAAIISSVIIMSTEMMFSAQSNDAESTTQPFGGIPVVVRIEISQLGPTDEFDVVFELPYISDPLPEERISWVVMCLPAGSPDIEFDSGPFTGATPLSGDGNTGPTVDEFLPGENYRIIISLDNCDIENLDSNTGTLIFMVENGRTVEKTLDLEEVSLGKDLM